MIGQHKPESYPSGATRDWTAPYDLDKCRAMMGRLQGEESHPLETAQRGGTPKTVTAKLEPKGCATRPLLKMLRAMVAGRLKPAAHRAVA